MNFIEALKVANGVLETYKREQPKWWARMDGTPILNDLAVRMAEAFVAATQAPPAAAVRTAYGVLTPAGDWVHISHDEQLAHGYIDSRAYNGQDVDGWEVVALAADLEQAPPAAVVPEGAVISAEGFALIEGLARGDLPSWKMREAGKELDRIRAALAANKENNDAHR